MKKFGVELFHMNKILIAFLLYLTFCTQGFAESYYFKGCKLDEKYVSDYIIDFEKNIIDVSFLDNEGTLLQAWTDKIELITKYRVTSKIIQSKKKEEFYTQYYLDVKSKSVFRQGYFREHDLDILRPKGAKSQGFCDNVKADWDISKIQKNKASKDLDQVLKTQENVSSEKTSIVKCEGSEYKNWSDCQGTYEAQDRSKYTGYFKNGNIVQGSAIYPGGSIYKGEFEEGKPNGQGTFIYADGSKYIGEWKNGKNHGQGISIWKDGRKYVGEFIDDKPHGEGTFTYSDGSKYVGEWKNGKRHGKGTLTYSTGKTYLGQFIDGEEHGEGTCFEQDGSSIECKKDIRATGRNTHNISSGWKKWIKISEYDSSTGKAKKAIKILETDFEKKASELCASTGNFDVLQKKIEIIELDETPAYGLETVVKLGINGVVECK